jgi:hypothetical protein
MKRYLGVLLGSLLCAPTQAVRDIKKEAALWYEHSTPRPAPDAQLR